MIMSVRTIREQELMLAAALDTVYHAFGPARNRASDLDTDAGHQLSGELGAMARRVAQLSRDFETKDLFTGEAAP